MKTPSIKTLRAIFGDNAPEAKRILLLSSWDGGLLELREKHGMHPSSTRWQVRMEALNALGDFCGVETLALGDGSFVDYLNAGDAYSPTLLRWRGNYYVGCWGDLVERHDSMDLQEAIARNGYHQH